MPCLLDGTPLAHSLKAFHAHNVSDIAGLLTALRAAPPADAARRGPVIHRLSDITSTEPRAVLEETKAVFAQQQWTVQGNVYQAGGDIHIHTAPSPQNAKEKDKPLIKKWQTWAGLAVLLTAVTLLLDLPEKLRGSTPSVPLEQQLAGQVLDETTSEPLPGVVVSLPDFDMKKTTEGDGSFHFRITGQKQASIRFTAQKDGYKIYSNYATLGNTDLRFPLEKSQ